MVAPLRDAAQFIIQPEGAGRQQLDHLQNSHLSSTKSSAKTLKRIFENFKYKTGPPPEGLARYHQRLHNLLKEMREAKPDPLLRNAGEILDTYRDGLARANMFKDELGKCEIGCYNLIKQTHQYLLERENVRGVHLRNLHGFTSKQLGLADVSNVGPDPNPDADSKELCAYFCRTGKCRPIRLRLQMSIRAPKVACGHAKTISWSLQKLHQRRKIQIWRQMSLASFQRKQRTKRGHQ